MYKKDHFTYSNISSHNGAGGRFWKRAELPPMECPCIPQDPANPEHSYNSKPMVPLFVIFCRPMKDVDHANTAILCLEQWRLRARWRKCRTICSFCCCPVEQKRHNECRTGCAVSSRHHNNHKTWTVRPACVVLNSRWNLSTNVSTNVSTTNDERKRGTNMLWICWRRKIVICWRRGGKRGRTMGAVVLRGWVVEWVEQPKNIWKKCPNGVEII